MKYIFRIALTLATFSSVASATLLQLIEGINLYGYQINFSSPAITAVKAGQKIVGKLDTRQGDFSSWAFWNNPDKWSDGGFVVILNDKTGTVFNFNPTLEAGGPFLSGVSADGNMIAFDFGTGTGDRSVEVWDSLGRKLMNADSYLGDLRWEQNVLVYDHPEERLDLNLNDETRACRDAGVAWRVKQKRFSRKQVETVDSTAKIVCSN